MPAKIDPSDMIGQTFGYLTTVAYAGKKLIGARGITHYYHCTCVCGNKYIAGRIHLKSGNTKSCGCKTKELAIKARTTHGKTHAAIYWVWVAMMQRCHRSRHPSYKNYGARGIVVCDRWHSFENFFEDMGDRPPTYEIDRIDNSGNYEPANCRWVTGKENCRNKRTNVHYTHQGVTRCVAEWSEITGIKKGTLKYRIDSGWPESLVFSKPSYHTRCNDQRPASTQ